MQQLLNHTDGSHVDHEDLTKALNLMKEVANHINENVKKTENLRKLVNASRKGTGAFYGLSIFFQVYFSNVYFIGN